jgi:hypothetical protein
MDQLQFETVPAALIAGLETNDQTVQRARVPGGWIVLYDGARRVKFCPCTTPGSDRVGPEFLCTRREHALSVAN